MPWVRFDDQYPIHRKVAALSDPAYRLHSASIPWSNRNLMDGWIPAADIDQVCAQVRKPATFALELVRRGLLHEAGETCPSPACPADGTHTDGWVIHDYWDYQPSKAKALRDRQAKADRQARWLAKQKGRPVDNQPSTGVELSTGDLPGHVPRRPKLDASQDATGDASKDVAPPRPAPKEAGRGRPAAPPAASSAGGAAGGEQSKARDSPVCRDCGNRTDTAYHRNTCTA